MTNDNFDESRLPGASKHPARDALDDIDEAVAQITDAEIEDRLRETIDRASQGQNDSWPGLPPAQPTAAAYWPIMS